MTEAQRPSPQTKDEWNTHALNIQGFFFERWCQHAIQQAANWQLRSINYPVEFPLPNGPLRGHESKLDIRAQTNIALTQWTLLIECKKHNPLFHEWIFFLKHGNRSNPTAPLVTIIENTPRTPPATGWTVQATTRTISLPCEITNECVETKGTYEELKDKSKFTRTSTDDITKAAQQIALATHAIISEEIHHSRIRADNQPVATLPYKMQVIVPTIVTTASLYTCSFDAGLIAPITGELPLDKAEFQEVPYLIFEYPLPRFLQRGPADLASLLRDNPNALDEYFMRMHILVINSNALPSFLRQIIS